MIFNKKTGLSLLLSATIIASASTANAFWDDMFGDEPDPLKTERRSPILNNGGILTTPAPSFNPAQGMNIGQEALQPPVMGAPSYPPMPAQQGFAMPQIPEPPQYIPLQPAPMPTGQLEPMQFAPPSANIGVPPIARPMINNSLDSEGFPKLANMPENAVQFAPQGNDPRAQQLKEEFAQSQQMAGITLTPPPPQEAFLPIPAPVMPNMQAMPVMPAPQTPPTMQVANVEPVMPAPTSFTVRSKRSSGAAAAPMPMTMPMSMPAPELVPAEEFASFRAPINNQPVAISPAPQPEFIEIPPAPSSYTVTKPVAPAFNSPREVSEASAPIASTFDSPIDAPQMAEAGFTVASQNMQNLRRPAMLPRSRYERYRKTGVR